MMSYDIKTLAKLAMFMITGAAGAAASKQGVDLSTLDLGQWLTIIGTGALAGGAFLHPTQKAKTPNEAAIASVQDVAEKAAQAHEKLTLQAIDSIRRVQEAAGHLSHEISAPPTGLTAQVIDRARSTR